MINSTDQTLTHSQLPMSFTANFYQLNRPKFEDVCLRDKLNDSNRSRAVKMRGLPWKVTVDEIVEFYKNGDFNIKPEDVVIERQDGNTIFEKSQASALHSWPLMKTLKEQSTALTVSTSAPDSSCSVHPETLILLCLIEVINNNVLEMG